MRVSAINSGIYCKPRVQRQIKHCTEPQQLQACPQENISFKNSMDKIAVALCGGIGAAVGGIVGFALGGPVGAVAGATLVGGSLAGQQYEENQEKPDDPNSSSYNESSVYDNHRYDY